MQTSDLYAAAQPIWQHSFSHPFITELTAGTLPKQKFRYYLIQDRYYLSSFSDLHAQIAQQVADKDDKAVIMQGAVDLDNGENEIRQGMFVDMGITEAEFHATPLATATTSYIQHMQAALKTNSSAVSVAALLPCYWLYSEIGTRLQQATSPEPIYQKFIDTYSSDDFEAATTNMIHVLEHLSRGADSQTDDLIMQTFLKSSDHETKFWDMAYAME